MYHELYAEQTARELRALEDRIYDYDNAYNELLLELEAAAAENDKLRMAVAERGAKRSSGSGSGATSPSLNLDSDYEIPSVLMPTTDPVPNRDAPSFSLTPKVEEPKAGSGVEPTKPRPNASNPVPSGVGDTGAAVANPFPTNPNSGANSGELKAPNLNQPNRDAPGMMPEQPLPTNPGAPSEQLLPPPNRNLRDRESTDLRSSRIVVPGLEPPPPEVQTASAQVPVRETAVQDRRIVEVVFHPALCRGNNFDEQPGDDGLYLVLQTVNNQGEFVVEPCKITIVASDMASQEEDRRIALWSFSQDDTSQALQSQGRSQGYHFPLRWQEIQPLGDRIEVLVRFELPGGKRLVAKHEIVLHKKDSLRSVWTPRSENRSHR